jgi:hypothetical protein
MQGCNAHNFLRNFTFTSHYSIIFYMTVPAIKPVVNLV